MTGFIKRHFKNYFIFGIFLVLIVSVVYCLCIFAYFGMYPYIRNLLRGEHYYERVLKDKYGIDFGIKSMSSPLDGFWNISSGGAHPEYKEIEAYPLSNPNIVFNVFDNMEKGIFNDNFVEVKVAFNISNELTNVFSEHDIEVYSSVDFVYKDYFTNNIYFGNSSINDYNISLSDFCRINECDGFKFYLSVNKSSINDRKQVYDVINEFGMLEDLDNVAYDFCFFENKCLDCDEKNIENLDSSYCEKARVVFEKKSVIFDDFVCVKFSKKE